MHTFTIETLSFTGWKSAFKGRNEIFKKLPEIYTASQSIMD